MQPGPTMRDVGATTQMDPNQLRSLLERERPTEQMRALELPRGWTPLRLAVTTLALAFALFVTVLTLF
jgi:hypothetical protein